MSGGRLRHCRRMIVTGPLQGALKNCWTSILTRHAVPSPDSAPSTVSSSLGSPISPVGAVEVNGKREVQPVLSCLLTWV